MIWLHRHSKRPSGSWFPAAHYVCPFCQKYVRQHRTHDAGRVFLSTCSLCGWWAAWKEEEKCRSIRHGEHRWLSRSGAVAILQTLDGFADQAPLEEIRRYLAVRWPEGLGELSPYHFEDVAASVLRPCGWSIRLTARSRDNGIDAIFEGPDGSLACLQAKHIRDKVGVSEIREFLGALVDADITRGFFASTSPVTGPARALAERTLRRVQRIELYDGPRFLDALRVRQTPIYSSYAEWKESVGQVNYHIMENVDAKDNPYS